MKSNQILAVFFIALCFSAPMVQGDYLGKNKNGVDMFSIDLDLPANLRFVEVSGYYKDTVNAVLNEYLSYIPWVLQYALK